MFYFHNDYNETCHPVILEKIANLAGKQIQGYGTDSYSAGAADLIRGQCNNKNVAVHFLVGGTQANLTVISAALRPHQAAIGAATAHINVHETGAVEATGHKVLSVNSDDGKLTASQIDAVADAYFSQSEPEHMVQPKLVYISNPTELGTIYTKVELTEISDVCKKHGLYLYLDGARLGYALAAESNDLTIADLAELCDVFYIGGTKVGAMFGEAVVISNPEIAQDFRYLIKQHGGMLAKGWLLGVQFAALFEDDMYLRIAKQAVCLADRIRNAFVTLGYPLLVNGDTNQIFPILPIDVLRELESDFTFMEQEQIDDAHKAVRFCTSWATSQASVDALCNKLLRITERKRGR